MKTGLPKRPLGGKELENLFWAYFNNKMMILLMMVEHPEIAKGSLSVEKQKAFLNDLYHHFLSESVPTKYHHAFRWLETFLDHYPNINYKEIYKAIQMIGLIYQAFGKKLDPRLEAVRIERETENGHIKAKKYRAAA